MQGGWSGRCAEEISWLEPRQRTTGKEKYTGELRLARTEKKKEEERKEKQDLMSSGNKRSNASVVRKKKK